MDDIRIAVEIPEFSGIDLSDEFLGGLEDALGDVASERGRHLQRGYNNAHDDAHSLSELVEQTRIQLQKIGPDTGDAEYRERMVQVAAVAVAAVQSFDRRQRRAARRAAAEAAHG